MLTHHLNRPSTGLRAVAAVGYVLGLVVAVTVTWKSLTGTIDNTLLVAAVINAPVTLLCGMVVFRR